MKTSNNQVQYAFIPQPHSIRYAEGYFVIPITAKISISEKSLEPIAIETGHALRTSIVIRSASKVQPDIRISYNPKLRVGGYRIKVSSKHIDISVHSLEAGHNAIKTLHQLYLQKIGDGIDGIEIIDWPDFPVRGIYQDITRGRVPLLESLKDQVRNLAHFKINQFQLYIEHVFKFKKYPEIWKGVSPLTSTDIIELDHFCKKLNVELVPSLAMFGHMSRILSHSRLMKMSEDWGVGRYTNPEVSNLQAWQTSGRAKTISPAHPNTYRFLEDLASDLLPLFTSKKFNVCCDETFDLGYGQSYDLIRKKGVAKVYLDHLIRLRAIAAKHGKKIQFWGDIIKKYPDMIKRIPKDITVLDWMYSFNENFESIGMFKKNRLKAYACPGTSSWVSLFPRIHEAAANIHHFAVVAKRFNADGVLATDWGDGGHYNFMELSWYGYLFSAEQSWNINADKSTFTSRFLRLFFGCNRPELAKAIHELGAVTHLSIDGYYQSFWRHVFFAPVNDRILMPNVKGGWVYENGRIKYRKKIKLDMALAKRTLASLDRIRAVFEKCSYKSNDKHGLLIYWLNAVDQLRHAAKKLIVFYSPTHSRKEIAALKVEMLQLQERFEKLWMAKNAKSEIHIVHDKYQKVISSYDQILQSLG